MNILRVSKIGDKKSRSQWLSEHGIMLFYGAMVVANLAIILMFHNDDPIGNVVQTGGVATFFMYLILMNNHRTFTVKDVRQSLYLLTSLMILSSVIFVFLAMFDMTLFNGITVWALGSDFLTYLLVVYILFMRRNYLANLVDMAQIIDEEEKKIEKDKNVGKA